MASKGKGKQGGAAVITPVDDAVFDKRAVAVGLLLCGLMAAGGMVWKFTTKGQQLKRPEEFQFTVSEPPPEELKVTEPQRDIVKEKMEQLQDTKEVLDESPNIQVSTNPVQIENQTPVIKSQNVEVDTPRIDVGATEISPTDAPVDLKEISDETNFAIQPIAADTSAPADLYKYKEPTPSNAVARNFIASAPRPAKSITAMPKQFGDQNAQTSGQLGPADINLFGTGEFFRMNPKAGSIKEKTAVDWALHWLAAHQETDGGWKTEKWEGDETGSLATTALSTLAFMGAGHNTRRGEYRRNVIRGIEYIMKRQDAEGHCKDKGANHYTHAICAIALCEAYGRARDDTLKSAAQKAIDYSAKAVLSDGGWRYTKSDEMSDTSVTAWFMQALKAAKLADLKFDPALMSRAGVYLDGLTNGGASKDSTGLVGYTYLADQAYDFSSSHSGGKPALTCAGMVIRQFNNLGVKHHLLLKGAEAAKKYPPDWKQKDFYYWYYATYAMHNMGGEYRIWWNQKIRDVLLQNQVRTGDHAGSWDPKGDKWAAKGGRAYCTALGALCLEVYYRYSEALNSFGVAPEIDELFFQGL